MGLWQRIVAWLFTPSRRKRAQGPDTPIEVDEDAIAEELQLLQEARRLGEAGQPAPNAKLPPGIEAQIVQRIDKARLGHVEWAANRLAVLNGDLARLDITAIVDGALQAHKEFARKADTLLNEQGPLLRTLADKARRARESLEEFRHKNGLSRNARYPEGMRKLVFLGCFLLFILVEAIFNAGLFATGMDNGLIGGFLYAGALAFVNVTVAALLGRFLVPNLFHRKVIRKVAGALGLGVAVVAMVSISLLIAHYRDALVADVEGPSKVAWATLTRAPFALEDGNSWILCCLSLLFASVALADGIFLDDVYPGYGRHAREKTSMEEEYQREIEGVREELEELKEEMLKQLDEDARTAQARVVRQAELLELKEKTWGRLNGSLFNAQRCMEALITRFRTENELYRKGLPSPASFSVMPTLQPLTLPDFKIDADRAALAAQQERLQQLLERVQSGRAAIQSGFNHEFNALLSLEAQLVPAESGLKASSQAEVA